MLILDRPRSLINQNRPPLAQKTDKTIVVADFEFLSDWRKFEDYRAKDGDAAHWKPRWPFGYIVCASWVVIDFPAAADKPEVSHFYSLSQPHNDQTDIVEVFFRTLEQASSNNAEPARLVTWGGDLKDIAALHLVAQRREWILPPQLRNTSPHCPQRLDLCQFYYHKELEGVHLSEFLQAQDLPVKPNRPTKVTDFASDGNWKAVEEHCAADVMLTAILAVRHLASTAQIGQTGKKCTEAILDRFCNRSPTSYTRYLQKWRKENLGYRGTLTCRGR